MTQMSMYETDLYAWSRQQAALLRTGQISELDLLNLAEEIESMGNSERRQLENRMEILIAHLLKWQFQPMRQGNSWSLTIREQRRKIAKLLKKMPSLRTEFGKDDWLPDVWEDAVFTASRETGFLENAFPQQPIWTLEQILDTEWLPESQ